MLYPGVGRSLGTDYFLLHEELSPDERAYWERTRDFVDLVVLPQIGDFWDRAEFPFELVSEMAKLGIVGDGIEGYGCPPMSPVAAGLVHMEINRGDGSLGAFLAIQSGLVMKSIDLLGSEEQRQQWLPGLASLDSVGAFAMTEPLHLPKRVLMLHGDWPVLNMCGPTLASKGRHIGLTHRERRSRCRPT